MLKKYTTYLLAILLVVFSGCTDLDVTPKSDATDATVFEDENSYRGLLAKLYAGFAVSGQQGPAGDADIKGIDEGFSNYLRQYWKAQELTTDEAVIGWGDAGLQDYHTHIWTSSNPFVTALYNRIFFQISLINEFLRQTTDEKLDSRDVTGALRTEIGEYRAEARFLRALSYWHGIDLFGDIPFVTENDAIGNSVLPQQGDRATIFSFIESELLAIENEMIAPGQNEYGRADRAALWTLLSKLYLNAEVYTGQARYTEAANYANEVISSGAYSLQPTYYDLFLADNHLSNELIFVVAADGEHTQNWGSMTFLVHAAVGGSMNAAEFGINGGWWGLRTTSALVDLFPSEDGTTDVRGTFHTDGQNKEINNIGSFNDGYAVPKYRNVTSTGDPGVDENFPDTDFPMFRLADVYLIYAESVVRGGSGSMTTAVSLINELRERAYGDASGNITSADLTLGFILDERARELYWEGHRRTDLIRFNQFTENGIWPWKGNVAEGRVTENFRDLMPIPASELLANPTLEQNTGY